VTHKIIIRHVHIYTLLLSQQRHWNVSHFNKYERRPQFGPLE